MKKYGLLFLFCFVGLLSVNAQSMYRYILLTESFCQSGSEQDVSYIRDELHRIGVRTIGWKEYESDLRINPYEVCAMSKATFAPDFWFGVYGWRHMELVEFGNRVLYSGTPQKFFKSYTRILRAPEYIPQTLEMTDITNDEKLKEFIGLNGITDGEGIYRLIGYTYGYKIGIVNHNNQYKIIILEDYPLWKSGEVIGYIEGDINAAFNIDWYVPKKRQRKVLGLIDNNILHIDLSNAQYADDPTSQLKFLKVYPSTEYLDKKTSTQVPHKSASGIVLTKNGVIATNYHVIENASKIKVQIDNHGNRRSYNAKVLISDKINDLCLLQIDDESFTDYPEIRYGFKTNICETGTGVFAMGYPMSNVLGEEVKVTDGLISSKTGYEGNIVMYQISAPIQPGSSGGPLFDKQGNLVAITNAGVPDAQNVGYAIKSVYLKTLVDAASSEITLPKNSMIADLPFTQQVQALSQYIVLITAE